MCEAFALAYAGGDTTRQSGPDAAPRQAAARYGTAELRQQLTAAPPPQQSQRWRTWQRHDAVVRTEPAPYVGEAPPRPEAGTTYAATTVRRSVVGDGLHQQLPELTVYCTLTREAGQWRVDQVETGGAA